MSWAGTANMGEEIGAARTKAYGEDFGTGQRRCDSYPVGRGDRL